MNAGWNIEVPRLKQQLGRVPNVPPHQQSLEGDRRLFQKEEFLPVESEEY